MISARSICALTASAVLSSCAPTPQDATLQGYGEAKLTYVAAEDGGRISSALIREGARVRAGEVLFELDPDRQAFAAAAARAQADAALARTQNAGALAQAVRRAEADADIAARTLARTRALAAEGIVSPARLDADRARAQAADAALAQARAERAAAQRDTRGAAASAALAAHRVADARVRAPSDGVIQTIYRRPGEVVAPGAPLASMITPDGLRVRFFAPQALLMRLAPGAPVRFACDGCKPGLTGRVTYVASEPQFTPPIIYSREQREKLVFLIEATPDDPEAIRPGLPVDVAPGS